MLLWRLPLPFAAPRSASRRPPPFHSPDCVRPRQPRLSGCVARRPRRCQPTTRKSTTAEPTSAQGAVSAKQSPPLGVSAVGAEPRERAAASTNHRCRSKKTSTRSHSAAGVEGARSQQSQAKANAAQTSDCTAQHRTSADVPTCRRADVPATAAASAARPSSSSKNIFVIISALHLATAHHPNVSLVASVSSLFTVLIARIIKSRSQLKIPSPRNSTCSPSTLSQIYPGPRPPSPSRTRTGGSAFAALAAAQPTAQPALD